MPRLNRLFLLVGWLLSAPVAAQQLRPAGLFAPLPVAALRQDLEVFQQVYEAANPSLYRYRSHRQLDSAFTATRRLLTDTTTLLGFYQLLYRITSYTGSLHSDNDLPAALDSALQASAGFFPYPVQVLEGKLRLNTRVAPLPLGSELVRINGHPATELLTRLGSYATTDGYNQTGKAYLISTHFARYYCLAYGPCATFRLTYRGPYLADSAQLVVAAVPYSICAQRYRQRHSAALENTLLPYKIQVIDSLHTALLTVNTFELGGRGEASQQRYARFLDSTFQLLHARPALRRLVVDVRQNGGGDDPNDILLFSYLARHRYRENRRAFTIFKKVPYPAYFVEDNAGDRDTLEQELSEEHGPARRGRYWLRKSANPYWQPNPLAFQGSVYLLIGPAVASAGSLFASLVRNQPGPVIIGEETMGGYYGHTGHTPVAYLLPNTRIRVRFSIIDLDQDVRPRKRFPVGRGIMPDYRVTQRLGDFIRNEDAGLREAWRLISNLNKHQTTNYLAPKPRR
ncbi:MAG: peptidase S41 [Cytophagaceae bacterium]|nr:MAG: peptidase S41 [Cytophagaceae bacterium]